MKNPQEPTRLTRLTRPVFSTMSSTNPPNQPPSDLKPEGASSSTTTQETQEVTMDTTPDQPEETWDDIPEDVLNSTTDEILTRIRLIDNDVKVCLFPLSKYCNFTKVQVMRSETLRLQHEQSTMKEKIRDNGEKVKQNKVLPYLVGNVVEVCLPRQ